MDCITDRYYKREDTKRTLADNARILSQDNAVLRIMNKIPRCSGGIETVRFILGFPDNVKQRISEAFGKCYVENDEGYCIVVAEEICIYSSSPRGLFYGANALLRQFDGVEISEGIVYSYPCLPARCAKIYIPARNDIPYFKEYIDYCAYYGYNTIMLEIGGAMEYKRHPEINEGWIEYCQRFIHYQGESLDVQNACNWGRNSIHMENGGGSFLTQEEVRELRAYMEERYFEIIPEVPTLSHCDYLLTRHPELREREEDDLPDTYCPSNPDSYALVFDVLDEVIEVFEPKQINIGHDELLTVTRCAACRTKRAPDLYAKDILKIHNYLASKGIKTAMWAEMLLNSITDDGEPIGGSLRYIKNHKTNKFKEIRPATYEAFEQLPNDIVFHHWYYNFTEDYEQRLTSRGNKMWFSNFVGSQFEDFSRRAKLADGIAISNWSCSNHAHMQRNGVLIEIAYSAAMLWTDEEQEHSFEENTLRASASAYRYSLYGKQHFIEVIHRTNLYREHPLFVDGFMVDFENDYLGKYRLTFASGQTMEFPLYYGLNIGTAKVSNKREKNSEGKLWYDPQLYEATYTCKLESCGGQLYYRTAIEIPEGEHVISIQKVEDSQYGSNIDLIGLYI